MSKNSLPRPDAVAYDGRPNARHTEFDRNRTEPISSAVVKAVADAANVATTDLGPIYDYVEPEALDELFEPLFEGGNHLLGSVSFPYEGHLVTVYSDGRIDVERREGDTIRS